MKVRWRAGVEPIEESIQVYLGNASVVLEVLYCKEKKILMLVSIYSKYFLSYQEYWKMRKVKSSNIYSERQLKPNDKFMIIVWSESSARASAGECSSDPRGCACDVQFPATLRSVEKSRFELEPCT